MAAKPWLVIPLVLPVGDTEYATEYAVQPINYADGLTLIATVNNRDEGGLPKDAPEDALYQLVMGDTWTRMRDDGCPYPVLFRAGNAALQYQIALVQDVDMESAVQIGERVWEAGLDPEAVAAWAAAITKPQPETSTRSTSTAGAGKTQRRASTSGTRSPRTTQRSTSKGKPAPSSGRRSSSSGRSS